VFGRLLAAVVSEGMLRGFAESAKHIGEPIDVAEEPIRLGPCVYADDCIEA
jgi:hypothetical protein